MAGLVLAMLVYPALSFPPYYNEFLKLPESRELEFKGEGIIICCSMTRSPIPIIIIVRKSVFDSIVHAKHYNNNIILFLSHTFNFIANSIATIISGSCM